MRIVIAALLCVAAACGSSRSTFAQYPGAPPAFDRANTKPEALELADKILAAAGGAPAWQKAKMVRWKQEIVRDGKTAMMVQQAWDRWNQRHWAEIDRDDGNNAGVTYEIYGEYRGGYVLNKSDHKQPVTTKETLAAMQLARDAFKRDTTVLLAPFLLQEPGSKLEYQGDVKDDATGTEYKELKVTFDPKDTARAGLVLHVYADKNTFVVGRISLENEKNEQYVYTLAGHQMFGGIQIATERKNVGTNEVIKISDIKVGAVDDELFMAPMFGPA
jgi:hypothetical protein